MGNRNIVDWKEAGKMLVEGKNFTEIAEHFGVTRQCIQQYYAYGKRARRTKQYGEAIVYPNLKDWFIKNRMSYRRFGAECFPDMNVNQALMVVRRILVGTTKQFTFDQIKAMSAVTGMTFEEMFRRDDEQEAANE